VTRGGLYSWAAYHSGGTLERGDRLRKVFCFVIQTLFVWSPLAPIFLPSLRTLVMVIASLCFPSICTCLEKSNVSSVLNREGGNNTCHRPKRARSAGTVLPECWPRGESLYFSLRLLFYFISQSLRYLQNDTSICMP